MTCCKHTNVVANVEDLRASAVAFGFDGGWIADIIEKYGPQVLAVVVEAVRSGLSAGFVVEILQKLGPLVLEVLVNLFNRQNMHAISETDVVSALDAGILQGMLERLLPVLVEKYGDQIVQAIVEWLLGFLKR